MTSQNKVQMIFWLFRIAGCGALLAMMAHQATHHHDLSSSFVMYASLSCFVSAFLLMVGAAIQAHYGFRKDAVLNAVLGVFYIVCVVLVPAVSG